MLCQAVCVGESMRCRVVVGCTDVDCVGGDDGRGSFEFLSMLDAMNNGCVLGGGEGYLGDFCDVGGDVCLGDVCDGDTCLCDVCGEVGGFCVMISSMMGFVVMC